jgi:hypothetical protein
MIAAGREGEVFVKVFWWSCCNNSKYSIAKNWLLE